MSVSSIIRILATARERSRTSLLELMSWLAPLVARLGAGRVDWLDLSALRPHHGCWQRSLPSREPLLGTDLVADQYLRRLTPMRVTAPTDLTTRIMARVATEPAAEEAPLPAYARRTGVRTGIFVARPLLRQAVAVAGTIGFSALLVLASSFVLTLANPDLGLTVVGALVNFAVTLLSVLRVVGMALASIFTNPGLVTALMIGLLGSSLIVWAQISRYYTARTAEA